MKTVEQLANLVVVRNHLSLLLNGTRNVIKKGDVQPINSLIQRLDSDIVLESLALFANEAAIPLDEDVQKRIAEAKAQLASKSTFERKDVKEAAKQKPQPKKGAVKKVSEAGDDTVNDA